MRVSPDGRTISVGGREGLMLPYSRWAIDTDGQETQVDLSTRSIWFEIAGVLRKQLFAATGDPKSVEIVLTISEIDQLPARMSRWAITDETGPEPAILKQGTIRRTGWTDVPPVPSPSLEFSDPANSGLLGTVL